MNPRWFAEDFVRLYDQVRDSDPDIAEEYGKWAHNARVWLASTPRPEERPPDVDERGASWRVGRWWRALRTAIREYDGGNDENWCYCSGAERCPRHEGLGA